MFCCTWAGIAWAGIAQTGIAWAGIARAGIAWAGIARAGIALAGIAWAGIAQLAPLFSMLWNVYLRLRKTLTFPACILHLSFYNISIILAYSATIVCFLSGFMFVANMPSINATCVIHGRCVKKGVVSGMRYLFLEFFCLVGLWLAVWPPIGFYQCPRQNCILFFAFIILHARLTH